MEMTYRQTKEYETMTEYDKLLVGKPDLISDCCVFCGQRATDKHHMIYRSRGGTTLSPLISVCKYCHSLIHLGLIIIAWDEEANCYRYLRAGHSTKIDKAMDQQGWRLLRRA